MTSMKRIRNPQARAALLAARGLLLGGGIVGVTRAEAQGKAARHTQADEKAPYKSSIQVPDDKNEAKEADEAGETDEKDEKDEKNEKAEGKEAGEAGEKGETAAPAEQAEAARYQQLARITAAQARSAALAKVPGT